MQSLSYVHQKTNPIFPFFFLFHQTHNFHNKTQNPEKPTYQKPHISQKKNPPPPQKNTNTKP